MDILAMTCWGVDPVLRDLDEKRERVMTKHRPAPVSLGVLVV